jgi:hypothetical protein
MLKPVKGKPRERRASASESNPRSKTPKDTKGMRWDLRKSRWVPDVPLAPPKPERDPSQRRSKAYHREERKAQWQMTKAPTNTRDLA